MIWWPWLISPAKEHARQAAKITKLIRDLCDTRDQLSTANQLLHGDIDKSDPDWWRRGA